MVVRRSSSRWPRARPVLTSATRSNAAKPRAKSSGGSGSDRRRRDKYRAATQRERSQMQGAPEHRSGAYWVVREHRTRKRQRSRWAFLAAQKRGGRIGSTEIGRFRVACRGPRGLVKQLGTYNCQSRTGTRGLSRASFHRRLPVLPKRRRDTGWSVLPA